MQVRAQLQFLQHIGFDQGLAEGVLVVGGLAHEGLGNGGDQGVDLDLAVGIDICQLQTVQPQNVHPLTVTFDVAGDFTGNDGSASLLHRGTAGHPG